MKQKVVFISLTLLLFVGVLKTASAQQDPPRGDCCFQIYSVGSNLGWATGLLAYTSVRTRLEPADEAIFQNLIRAGQHVEAAYGTCSKVNPAWKDWAGRQQYLSGQVAAIRQRPDPTVRRQVAAGIASTYDWGKPLRVRVFNDVAYEHETCAEKYFRLGYTLAHAAQTLAIAEERLAQGRNDWSQPVDDARASLNESLRVLSEYAGVDGCTEIGDLRLPETIGSLLNSGLAPRAAAFQVRGLWQSLQQRLTRRCDSGAASVTGGGGNIVGRWSLRFAGAGGAVGTANENVVTNRGEMIVTMVNGRYEARLTVYPLPWEELLDVSFDNGVLRFTRSPRFYNQFFEGVMRDNRLEGTFSRAAERGRVAYRWWGDKAD